MAVVIVLRWPLGWTALGFGAALLLFSFAPWRVAVAKMPWKVIGMVVTISTAVGFIEQAGGLQWFQAAVSNYATPLTVHPLLAFLTDIISAYSSTSSVVLRAFLPMVPGIAVPLPGTDALALAVSINLGSTDDRRSLYRRRPGRLEQTTILRPSHDLGLRHGVRSRLNLLLRLALVPPTAGYQ